MESELSKCAECQIDKRLILKYPNQEKHKWSTYTLITHRERGFDVRITVRELYNFVLPIMHCANFKNCNTVLSWIGKHGSDHACLDRIDNDSALELGNIQVLCLYCSSIKFQKTVDQWLYQIDHWDQKLCSHCGVWKDKTEFNGSNSWCKGCMKEATKVYNETHREENREKAREYYDLHREEHNKRSREYNKEHREEITKQQRERRAKER